MSCFIIISHEQMQLTIHLHVARTSDVFDFWYTNMYYIVYKYHCFEYYHLSLFVSLKDPIITYKMGYSCTCTNKLMGKKRNCNHLLVRYFIKKPEGRRPYCPLNDKQAPSKTRFRFFKNQRWIWNLWLGHLSHSGDLLLLVCVMCCALISSQELLGQS